MQGEIAVLLVYDQAEPLAALRLLLESQSFKTSRSRNCQETSRELQQPDPPLVVFTDTTLPDGTWREVVALAAKATAPVSVIVVGRLVDVPFYIEVIESGAVDFVAPPFAPFDLNHVTRCAAQNALDRRQGLTGAKEETAF